MEFSGTQTIAAPIEKVWAFLMDVNNVASCAPGFKRWKALFSVGMKYSMRGHNKWMPHMRAWVERAPISGNAGRVVFIVRQRIQLAAILFISDCAINLAPEQAFWT